MILFQIWLSVFVLLNILISIIKKIKADLPPVLGSFVSTLILVPLMVHIIIPTIQDLNLKTVQTAAFGKEKQTEKEMKIKDSERFLRGQQNLSHIDGEAGEAVIESLKDISPDFARYVIEYPFGDIYNRPELDLKQREIATIAALTTLGGAEAQLKVHIKAGLNVGLTRAEITEVIMQMSVYSGFPRALNGMNIAKQVFAEIE